MGAHEFALRRNRTDRSAAPRRKTPLPSPVRFQSAKAGVSGPVASRAWPPGCHSAITGVSEIRWLSEPASGFSSLRKMDGPACIVVLSVCRCAHARQGCGACQGKVHVKTWYGCTNHSGASSVYRVSSMVSAESPLCAQPEDLWTAAVPARAPQPASAEATRRRAGCLSLAGARASKASACSAEGRAAHRAETAGSAHVTRWRYPATS